MFIMSSHGPENFLLYITARIRTFLKSGIVRVRKNFIRIRTWGYVPSNNFMTCGSGSADPDVRIVIKFLMTTRGSGSTDPGVRTVIQEFSMMTRGSGEYGSGRRNRYVENYDDARILECGSGRHTSSQRLVLSILFLGPHLMHGSRNML
jgi:hypothetical protein